MAKNAGKRREPAQWGRNILLMVMLLVFFGGLCYALYPVGTGAALVYKSHKAAENFLQSRTENTSDNTGEDTVTNGWKILFGKSGKEQINVDGQGSGTDQETEMKQALTPYPDLLAAMQEYNERIYAEGQSGLCDAWAYQEPSFDLTEYGMEDGVIGVLFVPKINLEMPVYLGATYDNMANGAAHLSQTSLPIGGMNTNCVIAGHRGWRGAPFFQYLDKLETGDEITVTNLWETLTYRVSEIKVIEPNDIDKILIQPGRDMLSLITCHPYASGGKYRLVIYCERA